MRARHPIAVGLVGLCVQAMLLTPGVRAMPAPPPTPRDPQVAIVGGGLQAYLDARGQEIDVRTEQDAIQSWFTSRCPGPSFWLLLQLGAKPDGSSIGLCDATADPPSLIEIFPPHAGVGWFAEVEYLGSQARATIYLRDEFHRPAGTATLLGEINNMVGFYLHGPGGDFFTQDYLNAAGDPQLLSFRGTAGAHAGGWWIAAEDTPLSEGADRDFDDMIMYVEWTMCPLPVQRSTWAGVKSRFR